MAKIKGDGTRTEIGGMMGQIATQVLEEKIAE